MFARQMPGYLTEATMAAGGPHYTPEHGVFDEETWERLKKIRRLRELFHGRFPDRQCGTLLRHFEWDLSVAVSFILDEEPSAIREIIGEDEWQIVTVRQNNVIRDLARRDVIGAEIRQFGCKYCDNMWWRKVPTRKPVSRCIMCKRKRDAIPSDQEYGWAKFQCPCSNEFHAFGMMDIGILDIGLTGKSKCLCWRCMIQLCEPEYILKPLKNERGRRARYAHECTAFNCYNRCPQRQPNEPIVPYCVHPRSLQVQVPGQGSDSHVSTGSTVKTFLTQDELAPPHAPYEPSLADIDETRSESSGHSGRNGDNF
ncbi:shiftless antiviral inhibitor of ribosomal frameshifting protein homolog [Mercenaria mercenaria]|uniref:shiftless antiviral inhibitor of ribosomal frameshifting protein homolog n=1 Tax=Mercenaria mercenaria TaxID=6596 RepID=UPI00234E43D2|nr:shiftless antiviral inhibitor of ribosomal frameshifting protein homolog [Mercenaria mercenaria]